MLEREIKQELAQKVASEIQNWHAGQMMLVIGMAVQNSHGDGDKGPQQAAEETEKAALRKAIKLVDLVLATADAGKIVKQ